MRLDELHLIKKIQQNGDRAVADDYHDEIYGFMRKQVLNGDITLELTQDIFISMLKACGVRSLNREGIG